MALRTFGIWWQLDTDEIGRTTTYTWDEMDRIVLVSLPAVGGVTPKWKYKYGTTTTSGRNLEFSIDPEDNKTSYLYDARDRLTKITYPDPDGATTTLSSPVVDYTYNGTSQVTSVSNPTYGSSLLDSYTFDELGRLKTATGPLSGQTTTYTFGWRVAIRFVRAKHVPGDHRHLAGRCDDRHVVVLASFQAIEKMTQRTTLPGHVLRGLNQHPAGVGVATFGDWTVVSRVGGLARRGDQAQIRGGLVGSLETRDVSKGSDQCLRHHNAHAGHRHQQFHPCVMPRKPAIPGEGGSSGGWGGGV